MGENEEQEKAGFWKGELTPVQLLLATVLFVLFSVALWQLPKLTGEQAESPTTKTPRTIGKLSESDKEKKPRAAEAPDEVADQTEALEGKGWISAGKRTVAPAQLEADSALPEFVIGFTRGKESDESDDGATLTLSYFADKTAFAASVNRMKQTNRDLVEMGSSPSNSFAACGGHRIYLASSGSLIRRAEIDAADSDCEIVNPYVPPPTETPAESCWADDEDCWARQER